MNIEIKTKTKTKTDNSKWSDIRKVLSKCSERDLLGLVADLYALSKSNKDFLEARFVQSEGVLARYKTIVKRYIAPSEPWKTSQQISIKNAKKAISDYRKATSNTAELIDLMVSYVEFGTDFLCEFGDVYEQYYDSLDSMFKDTLKLMKKFPHEEIYIFVQRLRTVVKNAKHMGWGYYDSISFMLDDAYPIV